MSSRINPPTSEQISVGKQETKTETSGFQRYIENIYSDTDPLQLALM